MRVIYVFSCSVVATTIKFLCLNLIKLETHDCVIIIFTYSKFTYWIYNWVDNNMNGSMGHGSWVTLSDGSLLVTHLELWSIFVVEEKDHRNVLGWTIYIYTVVFAY